MVSGAEFNSFKFPRVLCIGDIMLDSFIYGSVERISPEAPVPVLMYKNTKKSLGGSGNVAANLISLGCNVTLIGCVGNDLYGKDVLNFLENYKNITSYIFVDKTKRTTTKTRYASGNHHMLRVDDEDSHDISSDIESKILELIEKIKDTFDVIVISDYNKGLLTKNIKLFLSSMNKIKIVDSKPKKIIDYSGVDIITPNTKELSVISNEVLETKDDIANAAMKASNDLSIPNVLVTCGKDGMILITKESGDYERFEVPALNLNPKDVSGAGDSVVAALTLALGSGYNYKQSTWVSNIAGALAVSEFGTSTIQLNSLLNEIKKY